MMRLENEGRGRKLFRFAYHGAERVLDVIWCRSEGLFHFRGIYISGSRSRLVDRRTIGAVNIWGTSTSTETTKVDR